MDHFQAVVPPLALLLGYIIYLNLYPAGCAMAMSRLPLHLALTPCLGAMCHAVPRRVVRSVWLLREDGGGRVPAKVMACPAGAGYPSDHVLVVAEGRRSAVPEARLEPLAAATVAPPPAPAVAPAPTAVQPAAAAGVETVQELGARRPAGATGAAMWPAAAGVVTDSCSADADGWWCPGCACTCSVAFCCEAQNVGASARVAVCCVAASRALSAASPLTVGLE